jgi:hypothetical protein
MPASYFLLRVQLGDDPLGLSGAIERLSTGEKRRFQTAQELMNLLGDWATSPKMLRPEFGGKQEGPAPDVRETPSTQPTSAPKGGSGGATT